VAEAAVGVAAEDVAGDVAEDVVADAVKGIMRRMMIERQDVTTGCAPFLRTSPASAGLFLLPGYHHARHQQRPSPETGDYFNRRQTRPTCASTAAATTR
jgi:hypothetical protein